MPWWVWPLGIIGITAVAAAVLLFFYITVFRPETALGLKTARVAVLSRGVDESASKPEPFLIVRIEGAEARLKGSTESMAAVEDGQSVLVTYSTLLGGKINVVRWSPVTAQPAPAPASPR